MDWKWLATFLGTFGGGMALILTGTSPQLGEWLVAGAVGQGATGGMTWRQKPR